MLRIPDSINSKSGQTAKIIQKWDRHRAEINCLLAGFSRHIINEKYIELKKAHKLKQKPVVTADQNKRVGWIERLLHFRIIGNTLYGVSYLLIC